MQSRRRDLCVLAAGHRDVTIGGHDRDVVTLVEVDVLRMGVVADDTDLGATTGVQVVEPVQERLLALGRLVPAAEAGRQLR